MQEIIASFSTIMTWMVLLLCLVVVVLLGLAAWHLPSNRRSALLGVVLMTLVVLATGVGWLLLSLYRLSFPPLVPGSHRQTRHQVLLLPASDWRSHGDRWVGAARSALPMKCAWGFLASAPGGRLACLSFGSPFRYRYSSWYLARVATHTSKRRETCMSTSRTQKRRDLPTRLPGAPESVR
jgi:amino acid transporter